MARRGRPGQGALLDHTKTLTEGSDRHSSATEGSTRQIISDARRRLEYVQQNLQVLIEGDYHYVDTYAGQAADELEAALSILDQLAAA